MTLCCVVWIISLFLTVKLYLLKSYRLYVILHLQIAKITFPFFILGHITPTTRCPVSLNHANMDKSINEPGIKCQIKEKNSVKLKEDYKYYRKRLNYSLIILYLSMSCINLSKISTIV